MKTYLPKPAAATAKWWVVDAENQILGRLAVKIADMLRGKNKPIYTPHLDAGDYVVVINAGKVRLTGRKEQRKEYESYSRFPGGRKVVTADRVRASQPMRMIKDAVWGMMPHKTRLARQQFRKLKLYAGTEHPHAPQNPETLAL